MQKRVENLAQKFLEVSKDKEIFIVSHFDIDGITSASIIIKTLKKLDKTFTLKIKKTLDEQFIRDLPKDKVILFLDLGSGNLKEISEVGNNNIFIIDHHEIPEDLEYRNLHLLNPHLFDKQKISASGLTYLFSKEINPENKELAKLAILGMIGDCLEKDIDKLNHGILQEAEITKKRGLLIYPSTRPLNRTLEYSSSPYIPGVTGDIKGVLELLRDANLKPENGKYKSILELDEKEMENLITSIMLRNPKAKNEQIVGDIFLLKFFNKLEDARELSAMINACSRVGEPETALQFCLEIPNSKKKTDSLHVKYKRLIISALDFVNNTEKVKGRDYIIINAKGNIKDAIVGTIASIISNSSVYEDGTSIITMAYREGEPTIKVSARNVGRQGRNVRELLYKILQNFDNCEVGGHEQAAGAVIPQEHEEKFLESLKSNLEMEVIKV